MKKKYAKPVVICHEVIVRGTIAVSTGIMGDKSGDNIANSPWYNPNW